jgi:glycosyltransferase involved in cell wall biosynthesis
MKGLCDARCSPKGERYHVVIPHFFDPEELPLNTGPRGDHFLFVGRLIKYKGLRIAVEACNRISTTLRIAGQGVKSYSPGRLEAQDGMVHEGNIEYIGSIGPEQRGKEMGQAKAVFVPSEYAEPFGNVAVEAQFCGTPVITTEWEAFPETFEHGRSGWRCRRLDHFVWAAENLRQFDPAYISQRAASLHSMEAVKPRYQEYFEMLSELWDEGWNTRRVERQKIQLV